MSSGQKNNPEESQLITLDPEEFNSIVKRVHGILAGRVERASVKKTNHPSEKAIARHLEVSKDAFVFVHMMELIEYMSQEIGDLRRMLAAVGAEEVSRDLPEMFVPKKTNFIN